MSLLKVIKTKCIECSGGSIYEVKQCTCEDCPLFPYRLGKNPFRKKRELTEEQKQAARERLLNARISKNSTESINEK